MLAPLFRRIRLIVAFNTALIVVGTIGYMLLEGWNIGDSIYMTIITLGSVGYSEVQPLTGVGRVFTSGLILLGVGSIAVSFTLLVEAVFSAEVRHDIWERRMQKRLEKLEGHVIVCGYGRVGRNAIEVVRNEGKRNIVVIDKGHAAHDVDADYFLVVEGDATEDAVLKRAGIARAWGLIVATGSDSVNLFVVLSGRSLNPSLTIVARSSSEENEAKMQRAGADRVISPYDIGGKRMAHSLLRPHLTEFLDVLTTKGGVEMFLEEIDVADAVVLPGKTLGEVNLRQRTGVSVLAVLRAHGVVTPDSDFRFSAEDKLIVIGTREQLNSLERLIE